MEENIGMRLELRESGWQFWELPLQASACYRYVGQQIIPNGRISSEYRLKSKHSAKTILILIINYKNIVSVFKLIFKLLANRWQSVTNLTTVHSNHGVDIQTFETSMRSVFTKGLSVCPVRSICLSVSLSIRVSPCTSPPLGRW